MVTKEQQLLLLLHFYPGCSILVPLNLRLSLQLSGGAGEAISIRQTLTETSLQLRGLLQSRLWFGVDWGVWQAGKVSSSPPLPLSQPLSHPLSLSLCGPPSGRDGRGGQGPNPTNSVSEAMHFPPSVCAKNGEKKREKQRERESEPVLTPTSVCLLLTSPGPALPHPIWAQNGLGPMCQGSHYGD